jgi:hypothetical protein
MKAGLRKQWMEKAEKVCREALVRADKFLEGTGFEHHQQEDRLELLRTIAGRESLSWPS